MKQDTDKPVVLLTRAYEQGVAFAANFQAQTGLDVDLHPAPLIEIQTLVDDLTVPRLSALLFTSANAVRVFAQIAEFHPYRALCVGKMTTAAARKAGYLATSADGALSELLEIATARHMEGDLPYFYPRGADVSGDLRGMLHERGTPCDEAVIYRQKPRSFDESTLNLIERRPVIAPIFSKKGGATFNEAIKDITPKSINLIAISRDVGSSLPKAPQYSLEIAQTPSQRGMIDALAASLRAFD